MNPEHKVRHPAAPPGPEGEFAAASECEQLAQPQREVGGLGGGWHGSAIDHAAVNLSVRQLTRIACSGHPVAGDTELGRHQCPPPPARLGHLHIARLLDARTSDEGLPLKAR